MSYPPPPGEGQDDPTIRRDPPPPGAFPPPPGGAPPPPGAPQPGFGAPPPPGGQPGFTQPPPGFAQQPGHGQQPGHWQPPQQWAPQPSKPTNGLAIASLIVGILSLPLLFACGFGAITGLVAIVLGIVGLQTAKKMDGEGRGLAIGGIVTGAIGLLAGIAFFAVIVVASDDINTNLDDLREEINSDPADGFCDTDRWLQDPDC